MTIRTALTRVGCLLLAGLVGTLLSTSYAEADGVGVGLSSDGVHWSDHISHPLFAPKVRWVPGDVRTARFYVRDQGPTDADIALQVERPARTGLIDTSYLHIKARSGTGPWVDVTQGSTRQLLDTTDLARGAVVPVTVRAAMALGAPNGTMVLSTDLDFRVQLSDSRSTAGTPGQGGGLPNTGSALRPWTLPLALLLLGSGTVLVLLHRRPTPQEIHHD